MAVYPLTIDTDANVIASLKAALTTAGILTTTHYQTTTRLIVTTTRSNKVIRFTTAGYRLILTYIGDAWESGDAVTNQVTIMPNTAGTAANTDAAVIVTGDILAVVWRASNSTIGDALFCRMNTATAEYLAIGWHNSGSGCLLRDTTNNAQAEMPSLSRSIISTAGYYYQYDPIVATASNILKATAVKGLKHLAMPRNTAVAHTVFGDDVVIPGGDTNSVGNYFPGSFLIVDGNSWAPA